MTAPLISPEQAARLLERSIFEQVTEAIQLYKLSDIEQRIARELAAQGLRGPAMLVPARGFVARALHQLAEQWERGGPDLTDRELEQEWEHAICEEVVAKLDAAKVATAAKSET